MWTNPLLSRKKYESPASALDVTAGLIESEDDVEGMLEDLRPSPEVSSSETIRDKVRIRRSAARRGGPCW